MQRPKERSPAAVNGRASRKHQAFAGAEIPEYGQPESVARVAVYIGRIYLGTIFEADGAHQAFAADGASLGTFSTRLAAARAFDGVPL